MEFTQGSLIHNTYEEHTEILNAICAEWTEEAALLLHSQIQVSQAEVRKITLDQIQMARQQTALFKCPDSGHPLPVPSSWAPHKIESRQSALWRVTTKIGGMPNENARNDLSEVNSLLGVDETGFSNYA